MSNSSMQHDGSGTSGFVDFSDHPKHVLYRPGYIDDDVQDCKPHKFDYSSSERAFSSSYFSITVPPEGDSKFKLTYLTSSDDNFKQEIEKIVTVTHLQKQFNFKFIDAVRVINPSLHEQCLAYQSMLQKKGQPSDFTYLFMDVGGYDPEYEHSLFENGVHTGNVPISVLGDPNTGVYLSTEIDWCSPSSFLPYVPHRIIIFKVLLGKIRDIRQPNMANPSRIELLEGYSSHRFQESGHATLTNHDEYFGALVYIFDKHDENSVHGYPRSIYPYAAVTLYQTYNLEVWGKFLHFPRNEFGEYELHFPYVRDFHVSAYSFFEQTKFDELAINGIVIDKAVRITDIGATRYMKEFMSGTVQTFQQTDELRIAANYTNPTTIFTLKHFAIFTDDPDFKKIVKRLRFDNEGLLFHVPNLSTLSLIEHTEMENHFGFIVPNCMLSTMLGIPYFAADILHCFILYKIPLTAITHPLRTIRREETLLSMTSSSIGRTDKISDNDIRYALSSLTMPQIDSDSEDEEIESESSFNERTGNETMDNENSVFMSNHNGRAIIDHSIIEMSDMEFEQAILDAKRDYEEMMEQNQDFPLDENLQDDEYSLEEFPVPGCSTVTPAASSLTDVRTVVIIEPNIVREALVKDEVLSSLMRIMSSENEKRKTIFNTRFVVIYHQGMQYTKLQDCKEKLGMKKISFYTALEKKYVHEKLLKIADNHICDLSKNNMRAALICCVTHIRNYGCNNAVFLSGSDQSDSDVALFKSQKIFLSRPENFLNKLSGGDTSFLY